MLTILIHWFARLRLSVVAGISLLLGIAVHSTEDVGWNEWGAEVSYLATVPILLRALLKGERR